MNILLLMMGGKGERFGAGIPKQYTDIEGWPLFTYIVSGYAAEPDVIHRMILIVHRDWILYVQKQMERIDIKIPWEVAEGGQNRSESVRNGLIAAIQTGSPADTVLIHDATHPYVDIEGTREVEEAVGLYGGATLSGMEYDTMYRTNAEGFIEKVLPRQSVVSGASPEAFLLGDLYRIYAGASTVELERMTSAGEIALAHGIQIKVIKSHYLNLKITYQSDMELFKKLKSGYFFV